MAIIRIPRKLKKRLKNAGKYRVYKGNRVRITIRKGGFMEDKYLYKKECITKKHKH